MNIHFRISIDAPSGWRRRILLYVAVPVGLLIAAAGIAFAGISHFNAGETLSADAMNGNFTQVENDIAAVQSQVAALQAQPRLGTFCGSTAGKTTGDFATAAGEPTGYQGGNTLCSTTAGGSCTSAAHMCCGAELVMSVGKNGNLAEGWYATGAWSEVGAMPAATYYDCQGYEDANGDPHYGSVWTGSYPNGATCDALYAILCCE